MIISTTELPPVPLRPATIVYIDSPSRKSGTVRVGETGPEQLAFDRQLEEDAIARYREGVKRCLEQGDAGTRELPERLLVGEEEHLDGIATQQSLVADIGTECYLQSPIAKPPETAA